jgi:hypothetical protein
MCHWFGSVRFPLFLSLFFLLFFLSTGEGSPWQKSGQVKVNLFTRTITLVHNSKSTRCWASC